MAIILKFSGTEGWPFGKRCVWHRRLPSLALLVFPEPELDWAASSDATRHSPSERPSPYGKSWEWLVLLPGTLRRTYGTQLIKRND